MIDKAYYTLAELSRLWSLDLEDFIYLAERRALTFCVKVNDALAPVQSLQMTGHQKLAEDLYRTDYENGWSVYVNYSDAVQQADGTSIPAKGYVLRQQTSAESEGGDF